MVEAGYQHSLDQLINKLKKLKKDYRDQKKKLERSGSGRSKIMPFFDLMHGVLGDRPANQATGALNSATAMLESMLVDESVLATSDADSGKRKRESSDLLEYPERSEERTQEQSRKDQDVTAAILQTMQSMDENASAVVGLMGRMVLVLEGLCMKP
ncbi:uncharacterized protein LOC115433592 [Scomber scombrus]|uniref:Uncharacterized protein LOC115433592 n=1 Tax=Scomber scombrus TaxID=13677 RepID=A0AAV1PXH5_SCOSC